MKTKTISKVIVYYEDGTYEEVKASISIAQNQPDTSAPSKAPVTPDLRPDWKQIQEWQTDRTVYQPPVKVPNVTPVDWLQWPYTTWCGSDGHPLNWKVTSTGNELDHKYTITSTGNGNVDISK